MKAMCLLRLVVYARRWTQTQTALSGGERNQASRLPLRGWRRSRGRAKANAPSIPFARTGPFDYPSAIQLSGYAVYISTYTFIRCIPRKSARPPSEPARPWIAREGQHDSDSGDSDDGEDVTASNVKYNPGDGEWAEGMG